MQLLRGAIAAYVKIKRWEMRPRSVQGGDEALLELQAAKEAETPYGLILLDMHMPLMDCFQFVERIRKRPELSTATIMMLTSPGHRGDVERCKALGMSGYLLKPIRQSELREAIARVLGAKGQRGPIPLITRYALYDARDPQGVLNVLPVEDNAVNQCPVQCVTYVSGRSPASARPSGPRRSRPLRALQVLHSHFPPAQRGAPSFRASRGQ